MRRATLLILAAVLSAAGVVFADAPAHADPTVDANCTATLDVTFTPGINFQTRSLTFTAEGPILLCAPAVSLAGDYSVDGAGEFSCLSGTATGSAEINWNTNETSEITYGAKLVAGPAGAAVVFTGEVDSGKFAGDDILFVYSGFSLSVLQCLTTTGIEEATGNVSMTFTHG